MRRRWLLLLVVVLVAPVALMAIALLKLVDWLQGKPPEMAEVQGWEDPYAEVQWGDTPW